MEREAGVEVGPGQRDARSSWPREQVKQPAAAKEPAPPKEPTTVFVPGKHPKVLSYEELPRAPGADRGSRAETVSYGGGLRPTSRRVAAATLLAGVLAAGIGLTIYFVNAEVANGYSAAVVPANVVALNFQETAPLEAIYVTMGERVHRGELLAVQQDNTLRLETEEQRLVVSADKLRVNYLARSGLTGRSARAALASEQLALARASLAEAAVQLAVDRSRLGENEIRSPLNGTVLHVAGTPGDLVGPSGVRNSSLANPELPVSSIFRLFPGASGASTNLSSLSEPVISLVTGRRWQVVAAVPETAIGSLRRGEPATFTFDTMGGLSVPAAVQNVVEMPFQLGGQVSYEVVLRLRARLPRGVLPGMTGTVSFS